MEWCNRIIEDDCDCEVHFNKILIIYYLPTAAPRATIDPIHALSVGVKGLSRGLSSVGFSNLGNVGEVHPKIMPAYKMDKCAEI